MAAVSSHNPSFNEFDSSKQTASHLSQAPSVIYNSDVASPPRVSRNRTIATVATVAVVGAAAMAIGVLIGNGMGAKNTTAAGETSSATVDVVADAVMTLSSMYRDQPSLALIKSKDIEPLVAKYENTHPNLWANNFVPEKFVAEWSKIRQAESVDDSGRRLREQRELIGDYPVDLARAAHKSTFNDRNDPIVYQNDAAGVEIKKNRCIISFDTSKEFADWIDNLNIGNGPIFSVKEYTEANPSCPTSVCKGKRILGEGYDGFRVAWNGFNTRVWDRIQSLCVADEDVNEYVFTGYSRGGAIAAIASSAIYLEGLLPASQIKLVTFGSPLSVSTIISDTVHNKFEQFRFVNKGDPVPAVPFMSWGVRHFGQMRRIGETFFLREGRDLPGFFNIIAVGSHGGYEDWKP